MPFWLVKTEPEVYSIADLRRDKRTPWGCVRNYQARNYLREMAVGDELLIYHSNADPTGIVGLGRITKVAEPDETQFDKKGEYFDPKATREAPKWWCPTVEFVKEFPRTIGLQELREIPILSNMVLLKKGSRLSVQPVTTSEFKAIVKLAAAI